MYAIMQLITEFLNSPEALLVGRIMLATSLFLCIYAVMSKIASNFSGSKMVSQGIAIIVSLYAFQIPFPPSAGLVFVPFMWEVIGLLNLVFLIFSLAIVKYVSGVGLMVSQFARRKLWLAVLVAALFIFVVFLPIIVQMLHRQLGEFFPLAFNLVWLLDLGLTIFGAIRSVFGTFGEIIEGITGKGYLAQTIAIVFIIVSILVIPQVIPYGSIIPKLAATVGILTATKYRFL